MMTTDLPIDKSRLDRLIEIEATMHARMLELIGQETESRRLMKIAAANFAEHENRANRDNLAQRTSFLQETDRKLQEARSNWSSASQLAAACRAYAKSQGIAA